MKHKFLIQALITILFVSACAPLSGTIEVSFATPTPEIADAPVSSPSPIPPTSTITASSDLGQVVGRVCYPGSTVPEMTAYFQHLDSGEVSQLTIAENQENYSIDLEQGDYLAYAYREGASIEIGGMYSQYVACGALPGCIDHNPLAFDVLPGQTTAEIDICDWYAQDLLPQMPGKIAQDGPYKEIAGLVYTDIPANETWMVDANGFPQRLYPERDAKPSPDGGRVLIDREEDIWLVDLFTGEQQNLTAGSNRINGSSQWWPANPDTIIFNSTSFDNPASMSFGQPSMMQQDGSDYQALDENYSFWRPATAPDGKTIAYDTATAAWLYNTDSGKEQLDPASYGLVVPEDFKIGSPAWSPDGTQVTWWVGGSFPPSGIWKMALASFDLTNKSYSFLHEYQPVGGSGGWREPAQWSPDGEWLAFTTQGQGRVPELMIMRADGSETVSLGSGTLQLWSPDSSKLLFIRYDGSYIESQIIMVELDTMQSTVLDLPPGSQQIQWGLR
jgi:hypothetical protein